MKIGIHTSALGIHKSGGILCIVSVLNELVKQGNEVCCFVDEPNTKSGWLKADFPIYHSSSVEYRAFDGILVSPYSPTAKAVAEHANAQDKFYWVHTNEGKFVHNGPEWQQMAVDSYQLPLKIFCTSTYVKILMEMVYDRRVISRLVPPGVDLSVFNTNGRDREHHIEGEPLRVVIFDRSQDWFRGVDTAVLGIKLASKDIPIEVKMIPNGISSRVALSSYYKWADIFIDTSRLAGSPTPPKEAMACGAVPIVTHYGTTDYVLQPYNGYIVAPDRPKDVAKYLNTYYEMPDTYKESLHWNASESMRRWDWSCVALDFLDAIQEGVDRGNELLIPKIWNK